MGASPSAGECPALSSDASGVDLLPPVVCYLATHPQTPHGSVSFSLALISQVDPCRGLPQARSITSFANAGGGNRTHTGVALHLLEDGRGESFVPAEAVERLAAAAGAPLYGIYHTYLGRGVVVGRVVRFEAEGEKAARLALRGFSGEGSGASPVSRRARTLTCSTGVSSGVGGSTRLPCRAAVSSCLRSRASGTSTDGGSSASSPCASSRRC